MVPSHTVVCVKQVKQGAPEEWDESMPLPGDIIEGVAKDGADDTFISAKARSELSSHLGKINRVAECVWLKVRRGESTVKLRACVVQDKNVKMQRTFTVRAASDERHVAVLADLTFEECFELQGKFCNFLVYEFKFSGFSLYIYMCVYILIDIDLTEISRRVVNLDFKGFHRKGMKYDWKLKVGSYLPDRRSTVVSSILFMPQARERGTEALTVRVMAWFSAAVSSGIPLVFINIQTEQTITSVQLSLISVLSSILCSPQLNASFIYYIYIFLLKEKNQVTGKELAWNRQENINTTVNIVQAIRLWFLPGIAEVSLELFPEPGEARFGIDIKRTEEVTKATIFTQIRKLAHYLLKAKPHFFLQGFICVYSVTTGTAAERAGLGELFEQANRTGHMLVISRLQGKSLMPSSVDSEGLIHCCENADIKHALFSALERTEGIQLHFMGWPNQTVSDPPVSAAAALRPPDLSLVV